MKGLEPSTFCMASRRSSQLSYIRAKAAVYRGLGCRPWTATSKAASARCGRKAFNGRDLDALDAVTAPGFYNHNALPGTPLGPEGHRQVVKRLLWEAYPRRALRDRPTSRKTATR